MVLIIPSSKYFRGNQRKNNKQKDLLEFHFRCRPDQKLQRRDQYCLPDVQCEFSYQSPTEQLLINGFNLQVKSSIGIEKNMVENFNKLKEMIKEVKNVPEGDLGNPFTQMRNGYPWASARMWAGKEPQRNQDSHDVIHDHSQHMDFNQAVINGGTFSNVKGDNTVYSHSTVNYASQSRGH
jgi:hypothetical protein